MTTEHPSHFEQKTTPMMMQWHACKKSAKDSLLFFRMGDFYEAFYEDAITMARELELTLTKRQDIPMCGIPHQAQEAYIDRLLSKGYRVAVAEQTEDPKMAQGLVKREVVRVVTPGSLITSSLLSEGSNNFIASISRVGQLFGFALLDLTTADFRVIELSSEQELLNEIYRFKPTELVLSPKVKEKNASLFNEISRHYHTIFSTYEDWRFEHQTAHNFLINHFKVKSLDGLGIGGMVAAINAGGGLLSYLQESLSLSIAHITELKIYSTKQFMAIDRATGRHLELTEPLHIGASKKNTLLSILDHTSTPMGKRLLRQWIQQPLLNEKEILERQDGVSTFYSSASIANELEHVRDLERLSMRIASGYASPRDLSALRHSFHPIPRIKQTLQQLLSLTSHPSTLLTIQEKAIEALPEIVQLIEKALVDDPPLRVSDGKIFRDGYCEELDELRKINQDGKNWLAQYQENLKISTGIKTLKVSFNRMFGYYIEVSKGQADKMPSTFQRRQTLVNAERFISPELKSYEHKVMHAEERISAIESDLFLAIRQKIAGYVPSIRQTAGAIAIIDSLCSLATSAKKYNYVRPLVDQSNLLHIVDGRHPVIEAAQTTERFIPNDTLLDGELERLQIITGPNMAGKSTYIRQVAMITIMAQMGSFVPATKAHIGIVDAVFSRIGASDNLADGHSTFMVEMIETASILNNATSRSLIILDEIGRGTSTYDGISIAWAVAEHLLLTEGRMAKTLFATHYWELTKLEGKIAGAVNYNVAVHETPDGVIFLRKIVRGGTDKSYGIHVGRLAGLPISVINRAKEILTHLEENANRKSAFEPISLKLPPPQNKR